MRKYLLATAAALALAASPVNAVTFTLSDGHGSGPFGEVTGFFTNAAHTAYDLHFDMNPNYIIDTGAHFSLTLSLNSGSITAAATTLAGLGLPGSPFSPQPHTDPASYANAPFGLFSDAVSGTCPNTPGNGGCGGDMWISVSNVNPLNNLFNPATNQFNGLDVFAAVDIYSLTSGQTFVVGLADAPTVGPFCATPPCDVAVPGPVAGAGIPGIVAACLGLYGFAMRRRKRNAVHYEVPAEYCYWPR